MGAVFVLLASADAQRMPIFEQSPIRYSKTAAKNVVTRLQAKLKTEKPSFVSTKELLKYVLKELKVPIASQVLVFSKTSLQKDLIHGNYPRALYFSDSVYVGYVQGGAIELMVHDPKLGVVFYTLKSAGKVKLPVIKRDDSCVRCHASGRTHDIPGVFIRSVFSDETGEVNFKKGSFDVTDETPFSQRWGGWYVTGEWAGNGHMGNAFGELGKREAGSLPSLKGFINTKPYLRETSDVVALSILEHQAKLHNALIAAKMNYERMWYFQKALDENARMEDRKSSAWKLADNAAKHLVEALLFTYEAELHGDGIEGNEEFAKAFLKAAKVNADGRSLRQLRLYGRLFKYRCSYMIHSPAFDCLPELVKQRVFSYLQDALNKEDMHEQAKHLGKREREQIWGILLETTEIKKYLPRK